jgi:NADH-quinone oxidoreductase subunit J
MPISEILFWVLSTVAVLGAMLVIASKNAVHSALFLIITFFAVAGHYFLLNAHFLAAVHIIVYAGAIMVLFLYAVMMLNLDKDLEPNKKPMFKFAAAISAGSLLLVLTVALKHSETQQALSRDTQIGTVESLGHSLFNEFMLPFEISALLFLSAMVGAVLLSKKNLNQE